MAMQLLVSVTDVHEAVEAVLGGADIIDVKNPDEGSLGARGPAVIRAVREAVPPHLPVSAALGDLPDIPGTAALAALGAAVAGADYVKIGLADISSAPRAAGLLKEVLHAVAAWHRTVRVVAVGFADGPRLGTIGPEGAADAAAQAGVHGCMLDTLDKSSGRGLLQLLSLADLHRFVDRLHRAGMEAALAGSIRAEEIPLVAKTGAGIVGVRAAACSGDRRTGRVTRERVAWLKHVIEVA